MSLVQDIDHFPFPLLWFLADPPADWNRLLNVKVVEPVTLKNCQMLSCALKTYALHTRIQGCIEVMIFNHIVLNHHCFNTFLDVAIYFLIHWS